MCKLMIHNILHVCILKKKKKNCNGFHDLLRLAQLCIDYQYVFHYDLWKCSISGQVYFWNN